MRCHTCFSVPAGFLALTLLGAASGQAQFRQEPGKAIGTVTTEGDLIVLTLNEGVLGSPNLFDLDHRTLRFTPAASGYRVTTLPLAWDTGFGPEMTGSDATLKRFAFPFSGQRWSAFSVGMTGSITFAGGSGAARPVSPPSAGDRPNPGGRGGGLAVDRFALLQDVGSDLINTVPAISVFFKPRMYGTRYLKELADRVVITWSLTEPVGGIQDMTWTPTVNRFQAVLRKDGTIDLSYNDVHAEDAVVGIYPMVTAGKEKTLATITAAANADLAPNLDITSVTLAAVDGLLLKATIGTRGAVPRDGDSAIVGVTYRVCLSSTKPAGECAAGTSGGGTAVWSIVGTPPRRGSGGGSRYVVFGPGVLSGVKVEGNSISVQGTLPAGYGGGQPVFASVAAQGPPPAPSAAGGTGSAPGGTMGSSAPLTGDQTPPQQVSLTGLVSPAVDLSSAKKRDGPFPVVYEAFHYARSPRPMDLTCTVIQALGDKFDFLPYYADFRIDNPEAGTPSTGPRGGGPSGGAVTGIGSNQGNLASYCSQGRFQWQYVQPVYVGANQMQEYPPDGVTDSSRRTVVGYTRQLAERTATGKIPPYNYAISQIAHEMGHRWAAFLSASVNGGGGHDTIQLGPTHWARGLQAPVAFPYQRPVEASAMGGGVWQDNLDGTFTQLDDDYYVPATGWSYLDLYLMGLIAPTEVPDFFILSNLAPAGRDPNGHPIVKAERTKITIQDVIAVEGPRLPDVEHSQRDFNTGLVLVVEPGKTPSRELIERVNGIRRQWIEYWTTTTGHRSTMTASPR